MKLNPNEAPPGHVAVLAERVLSIDDPIGCDECSMCVNDFCATRDPHSCSALDRKDRCDVIFKRKGDTDAKL